MGPRMITKSEKKYQKMVNSLPNHLPFVSLKILDVSSAKNQIILREAGLECSGYFSSPTAF